jgi:hypothetical protein
MCAFYENSTLILLRFVVGGMATIWCWGKFWECIPVPAKLEVLRGKTSLAYAMPADMQLGG